MPARQLATVSAPPCLPSRNFICFFGCEMSSRHSTGMLTSDNPLLLPIPGSWETAIRSWELSLRASGHRRSSVETRIRHIRRLARDLAPMPPEAVTAEQLLSWSGLQDWAPETRHGYHCSAGLFFRHIARDPNSSPGDALVGIRRHVPPPRPTPEDVLRTAVRDAPPRTRLILRLAAELGLRRSEISALHQRDLAEDNDGWWLTIDGKGGRTRLLPVTGNLADAIRAGGPTFVFPGLIDGHLSAQWISTLTRRVLPAGWSLHTLRHRFATTAYRQGGRDIISVLTALGHTSIQTTRRYTAGAPPDSIRTTTEAAALTTSTPTSPHQPRRTPMRITICNVKGGTGKTTSAIMLAAVASAAGHTTRVLDADPQGSASDWAALADDDGTPLPFEVLACNARSLTRPAGPPVDFEFVDCPPGMPAVINAAISTADAVIVPACPSGIEIARTWETLDLAGHRPAAVLLTSAQLGTRTPRDTQAAFADEGVAVFTNITPSDRPSRQPGATGPPGPGTATTASSPSSRSRSSDHQPHAAPPRHHPGNRRRDRRLHPRQRRPSQDHHPPRRTDPPRPPYPGAPQRSQRQRRHPRPHRRLPRRQLRHPTADLTADVRTEASDAP